MHVLYYSIQHSNPEVKQKQTGIQKCSSNHASIPSSSNNYCCINCCSSHKKPAVFRATQLCRLLLLPDTVTFTRGCYKRSVCLFLILYFVKCTKYTAAMFFFLIAYFDDLAVENFTFQGVR